MKNISTTNSLIWLTPLFLIALNLFLKLIFISSNSIGGDEPFSIYYAQLDISSIIRHLSAGNNPPLYEIILHFWIKAFGISELSVRFPSLIFSVLTALYIYKIGNEFFTYKIALIASLIFSFSNYHLAFSHEARVYCLFALLTSISMYLFLKICDKEYKTKHYLFLLLVNTLLIYSHYFGFYVVMIQTIATISISEIRKKIFSHYLIYLLGLIFLYIPNVNIVITRFLDSGIHGTWVKPPNGLKSIYNMLWQYTNKPIVTVFTIGILLGSLFKLILTRNIRSISRNGKIIGIWFLFPFLFMFIISYWVPMFLDRYLIFVSIGFYLVLSTSIIYIFSSSKINLIMTSILVLLFIMTFNANVDNKRHVKETVNKIKEIQSTDTKIIICPDHFIYNFLYYYQPELFKNVDNQHPLASILKRLKEYNIFFLNNINEIDLENCERIIYLDAACQFSSADNNIFPTLEKDFEQKSTYQFYAIFNIFEFTKK